MANCQVITLVTQLKNLLVIHDKAATQMQVIEIQIHHLQQQVFMSITDGQHVLTLHLLTKKSIADGVRKIYQQYRQRKLQQIQKLSTLIIQSLQEDVSTNTESENSNNNSRQRDNDDLAQFSAESFCVYSRSV